MEDILWAKNRHLFGGLEPSNMEVFTATANETEDGVVCLTNHQNLKEVNRYETYL